MSARVSSSAAVVALVPMVVAAAPVVAVAGAQAATVTPLAHVPEESDNLKQLGATMAMLSDVQFEAMRKERDKLIAEADRQRKAGVVTGYEENIRKRKLDKEAEIATAKEEKNRLMQTVIQQGAVLERLQAEEGALVSEAESRGITFTLAASAAGSTSAPSSVLSCSPK